MDCLVLPVTIWRRKYSGSRLGYRTLIEEDGYGEQLLLPENISNPVKVVVGKEKREFLVDPFVLEESPFRVLIDMMSIRKKNNNEEEEEEEEEEGEIKKKNTRVIFVDVDAILFEHMLWLMYNDCSSLFQLNLKEIIDFYALDY